MVEREILRMNCKTIFICIVVEDQEIGAEAWKNAGKAFAVSANQVESVD